MKPEDARELTLRMGEKWIDSTNRVLFEGRPLRKNRTYTDPSDWEWLRKKVVEPYLATFDGFAFETFSHSKPPFISMTGYFRWFLTLSVEDRCQLVLDFMRENHIGDEYLRVVRGYQSELQRRRLR